MHLALAMVFRYNAQSLIHERKTITMLDFIKIKNFFSVREIVKRMRRQARDWEKIFAKHRSAKGLASKLYKELVTVNNKYTNNLIKKRANGLQRHLTKENRRMEIRHVKRC